MRERKEDRRNRLSHHEGPAGGRGLQPGGSDSESLRQLHREVIGGDVLDVLEESGDGLLVDLLGAVAVGAGVRAKLVDLIGMSICGRPGLVGRNGTARIHYRM